MEKDFTASNNGKKPARGLPLAGVFLCLVLGAVGLPCVPGAALAKEIPIEYKIKAAFTYNFIKFIDWSASRAAETQSEFVISIIGEGPMNDALAQLENKEVFGKVLKVKQVPRIEDAGHSNVYFISNAGQEELNHIFEFARQSGILTIGEMENFCEQGGMINFIILNDSIQFEINQKEAERSHLSISYKLLSQASRVYK